MGAKWFCLSCIRRDLISSAWCVDSRKSSYNSPILRLDAKSEKSIVGVLIQYLLPILRLFQFASSILQFPFTILRLSAVRWFARTSGARKNLLAEGK